MPNMTNSYQKNLKSNSPVVAHEKSIATIAKGLNPATYAVGAMVYSDIVANPSQWVLVDSTTTTNAMIALPEIVVGVISCIHDEHDCSYDEIDADNIKHQLSDVKLSIVEHNTEAHLYQKLVKVWNGTAFVPIVQADYLVGGIFEGILEVVDASNDGDKPILKFKD